jgi:glycine cleavage system H lipoate-binding protein
VASAPEKVNEDAYGHGLWPMKPADPDALPRLLDATAYAKLIAGA